VTHYALYRMQKNHFLGECLAIVGTPTSEELTNDALQAPLILVVLKSRYPVHELRTINDLQTAEIFDEDRPILLRVASECLFGVFGDSHCDCEAQRMASIREIQRIGQGLYIHLPQEAQGNGLFYKAQELQIQVSGVSPSGEYIGPQSVDDASQLLLGKGVALDRRNYTAITRLFKETRLDRFSYNVITDSPDKVAFLKDSLGIRVEKPHPAHRSITVDNAGEFLAKLYRKGYTISNHELEEIYLALFAADKIPGRVLRLLRSMEEDLRHGKQFEADADLLQKIVSVVSAHGFNRDQPRDFDQLKDVSSYEEYQLELRLGDHDTDLLFQRNVLRGIDSLRYEENHFYDMASFEGVPARSLKIRYAFKISDPQTPVETKFIYKVPVGDKVYRIRSLAISYDEVAKLLGFALVDCEQHVLPVFTHNVIGPDREVTALLKRYTPTLRTLSLMGPEVKVRRVTDIVRGVITAEEIPDPSNSLFIDRKLSVAFNYDDLAQEELALYRKYSVG
jgi:GTP cyclohydrolase II